MQENKGNVKLSEGSSVIIDLVRLLASQLVVVGHGLSFFGILKSTDSHRFPFMQNIAVVVFFILSGFLITYSTVRKNEKSSYSFAQFFIDRFSRIFSAFVPAIVFVFLIDLLSIKTGGRYAYYDAFNLKTFFGNLLMLQDYPVFRYIGLQNITSFGSARPFWTVAIEWWIYLFFGFFLLKFLRKKLKFTNLVILSILAIVPVFNLLNGRGNGLTAYWLFGSLIYICFEQNLLDRISKQNKLFILFSLSILAVLRGLIAHIAYDPIFAFLLALTFYVVVDYFKDFKFSSKASYAIKYGAGFSYSLYLLHYSILDFIYSHQSHDENRYFLFFLGFILSNVISMTYGAYFETKLTPKIKNKLYSILNSKTPK